MSKVTIIGGGVIGLFSAYYLNLEGHEVSVFDQGDLNSGCSFGNAGMIVPSHIIPLAAPGMVAKGIRWMFKSTSPFYVKPRLSGELIKWGFEFYRHATVEHVAHAIPALKALSIYSKDLYRGMSREAAFDFGYRENGLLMLYRTKAMEEEEVESSHVANKAGVEARVLTLSEIQKLEPNIRVNARGGVYYPGDAQLLPQELMRGLHTYLKSKGVGFHPGTEIDDFKIENNSVKAIASGRKEFDIETLVLAGGSWSRRIGFKLGLNIPMQAGKGYSFTVPDVTTNTQVPTIFLEDRVAVTPMGTSLRFGGTMEITGLNSDINMNRVRGIVEAIPKYYPELKIAMPDQKDVWYGLRPCSPDGLPYIGRTRRLKNVVLATGHAMLGVSLGPGTGKLVSQIIGDLKPSVPVDRFDPDRYS
ncbi:MAG TPA: FAD-dependent oxidoreductase [Cyclobacteriaceae bacterium]|nr:FAD-dependent oxidoreductase [Cyclobacteriaceae bacterium]